MKTAIPMLAAMVALTLSACGRTAGNQADDQPQPSAVSTPTDNVVAGEPRVSRTVAPTPVATTSTGEKASVRPSPVPVDETASRVRACELTVDGRTHVDGPCTVFPSGDGYTLNTWDNGKPKRSHFAVVNADEPTRATAYWNADPDDSKANDLLGEVRKEGQCWVNARARICAR